MLYKQNSWFVYHKRFTYKSGMKNILMYHSLHSTWFWLLCWNITPGKPHRHVVVLGDLQTSGNYRRSQWLRHLVPQPDAPHSRLCWSQISRFPSLQLRRKLRLNVSLVGLDFWNRQILCGILQEEWQNYQKFLICFFWLIQTFWVFFSALLRSPWSQGFAFSMVIWDFKNN